MSSLRRHRRVLVAAVTLGAAAGAAVVVLVPPQYTSQSVVLLPTLQNGSGQPIVRNQDTEVQVASSDLVLGAAGRSLDPPMSSRAVKRAVRISAPTDQILEFAASDTDPRRAEKLAKKAAESEVTYPDELRELGEPGGSECAQGAAHGVDGSLATVSSEISKAKERQKDEVPGSTQAQADATAMAQLIAQQAELVLKIDQVKSSTATGEDSGSGATILEASPARRPAVVKRATLLVGFGMLIGLALACVVLGLVGRRDRRMRLRDEIADAIGGSVLASLRAYPQRSAGEWTTMMAEYAPAAVDVLALRHMLRQLAPGQGEDAPRPDIGDPGIAHPTSVTVVTLANDERALAMGPQIAAFAASSGVTTRLVPGRSHESAAALFAACSPERAGEEVRPHLFLEPRKGRPNADFTVVLAVIDRDNPDLSEVPRSEITVLAVSSGAATAEELARAAVSADESGREVLGVVVADAEESDRTTGRLLQHERAQQASLPSRLTGMGSPPPTPKVTKFRERGN